MAALPDCCGRFPAALAAPSRLKTLAQLGATVVLLGLLASLVGAGSATAAAPCWKQLVNDWYDGRIDRAYPVKCYRAALKNLPEDIEQYADAADEIRRALLAATRNRGSGGGSNGPIGGDDVVPPPPATGAEGEAAGADGANGDESGGVIGEVFDFLRPNNADSIPLPLLILAGLALLLLGAAAAGFIAKRFQARRAPAGVPPDRPPPA